MAEPNTTSANILLLLVGLLGPTVGQYSLIVMAALAGALWPLSTMAGTTRLQGALFLFRVVVTAIFISGSVAVLLRDHFDMPVVEGMSIVAFAVGAIGNGWRTVFNGLREGLTSVLQGFGNGGGRQRGGRGSRRQYDDDDSA